MKKKLNVQLASSTVTYPGVLTERQRKSHTYANMEKKLVVRKTPIMSIFFTALSPSPTAIIETALMIKRLKAAEPTIVDGPKSPEGFPKSLRASSTERMISGAEEPKAIRDKFAIVGFQTGTSI